MQIVLRSIKASLKGKGGLKLVPIGVHLSNAFAGFQFPVAPHTYKVSGWTEAGWV